MKIDPNVMRVYKLDEHNYTIIFTETASMAMDELDLFFDEVATPCNIYLDGNGFQELRLYLWGEVSIKPTFYHPGFYHPGFDDVTFHHISIPTQKEVLMEITENCKKCNLLSQGEQL